MSSSTAGIIASPYIPRVELVGVHTGFLDADDVGNSQVVFQNFDEPPEARATRTLTQETLTEERIEEREARRIVRVNEGEESLHQGPGRHLLRHHHRSRRRLREQLVQGEAQHLLPPNGRSTCPQSLWLRGVRVGGRGADCSPPQLGLSARLRTGSLAGFAHALVVVGNAPTSCASEQQTFAGDIFAFEKTRPLLPMTSLRPPG